MRVPLARFFMAMVFGLIPFTIQAQRGVPHPTSIPVQIRGQLRYSQGGKPAEVIPVRLEMFGSGLVGETTTDRMGRFIFTNLAQEHYVVLVRVIGFQEVRQEVDLRTQPTDYVQLQLVPDKDSSASISSKRAGVIDASVPKEARTEFERGRDLLLTNTADAAIPHLESAVQIYPRYFEAMLLLGTAYMDRNDWDKAEAALKRACELQPNIGNPWFALGELYLRQVKNEEAEKVLLQGLQIDDRSYQGHLSLAHVYWNVAAGFKDEAHYRPLLEKSYAEVKRALNLKPDLADAHLLKGNLLFRARRAEEALVEFEAYLRLEPQGRFAEQTRALVDRIKQALASKRND